MSTINIIAAMQSSILAATGKFSAPKIATAQTEPAANASSTTISQAARDALAENVANATQQSSIPAGGSHAFQQAMAEKFAGGNAIKLMIQSDPSNPMWTGQVESWAQHDFTLGHDVGYDCSGTKPGEPGRFLGGEPVTAESKAYVTQQTANYQNQLRDMISSEKAKGTAPSDILLKIFDQQGEQPARFRAMMAWPIASDFASSQPSAASGRVKT
ncbi:hypothetical protein [Devosia sp.]|uniref:hypothetical protein n=1 Tax=Devosia sp. TaxID=1871048 RepID=UPI00273712DC|nr:hypothetical protein [Devosia sp.]MDP2779962.1 hypothetical protein [Devosia sp.]